MESPDLNDLPRAYRIGLSLRELGADDALIGDCLGIDPAGVPTLIEIGRQKLRSEQRTTGTRDQLRGHTDSPEYSRDGFANSVASTEGTAGHGSYDRTTGEIHPPEEQHHDDDLAPRQDPALAGSEPSKPWEMKESRATEDTTVAESAPGKGRDGHV
jgi:hypothetical protein